MMTCFAIKLKHVHEVDITMMGYVWYKAETKQGHPLIVMFVKHSGIPSPTIVLGSTCLMYSSYSHVLLPYVLQTNS